MSIFALVDCNNFYASCERAFNPKLANKPIVVLSNNDGCIVARSNEAKALGIKMGQPVFQVWPLIRRHGVHVFSSNYTLYGDMSSRVISVLTMFSSNLEVYSIDEAFLELSGIPGNIDDYAQNIRQTVGRWTGIPVGIGLATSKTLAKAANHHAKKHPETNGVYSLLKSEDAIDSFLSEINVEDIWGIGTRNAVKLKHSGIATARQLKYCDDHFIQHKLTICGLRTVWELRGQSCIPLEEPVTPQSICTSRSFGKLVSDLNSLRESVAAYAARCAERLRSQELNASTITVFVTTNLFASNQPRYSNSKNLTLPIPTSNGAKIVTAAIHCLNSMYREGFLYKKAGVILSNFTPNNVEVQDFFEPNEKTSNIKLYHTLDQLNKRFGSGTVFHAAEGVDKTWSMKRERCSPRYTTSWHELLCVK